MPVVTVSDKGEDKKRWEFIDVGAISSVTRATIQWPLVIAAILLGTLLMLGLTKWIWNSIAVPWFGVPPTKTIGSAIKSQAEKVVPSLKQFSVDIPLVKRTTGGDYTERAYSAAQEEIEERNRKIQNMEAADLAHARENAILASIGRTRLTLDTVRVSIFSEALLAQGNKGNQATIPASIFITENGKVWNGGNAVYFLPNGGESPPIDVTPGHVYVFQAIDTRGITSLPTPLDYDRRLAGTVVDVIIRDLTGR